MYIHIYIYIYIYTYSERPHVLFLALGRRRACCVRLVEGDGSMSFNAGSV